jgi:hypothetical protein
MYIKGDAGQAAMLAHAALDAIAMAGGLSSPKLIARVRGPAHTSTRVFRQRRARTC